MVCFILPAYQIINLDFFGTRNINGPSIFIILLNSEWFGRFLGIISVILVILGSDILEYKSILVNRFVNVAPVGTGLFLLPAHQSY